MNQTAPNPRTAAMVRLYRKIDEKTIRRDKMPAACRGPLNEEIESLQRQLAVLKVGGSGVPKGLGL